MNLNSKIVLVSLIVMTVSQAAFAVVTSGIGMAYRGESDNKPIYTHPFFIEETIPGEEINKEWCVSKIVDDIKCDSFSKFSMFDPWQINTLCTLGVKLSPVLTSEAGERALGNDFVETYKSYVIWAKEDDGALNLPVDQISSNLLRVALNTEAKLLNVKQQLDNLISLVSDAPSEKMIKSIKAELERRSCSKFNLSNRFTKKEILKKNYLKVEPSCEGKRDPIRSSNSDRNFIACGLATFKETYKNVTLPVDPKTGKINVLAEPIKSSDEINSNSVERFCSRGEVVGDAEFNCNEEGERLQTLIEAQK